MAFDLKKIRAIADEAAETGPDFNNQTGGGDYVPPKAGATRLRFIEYVEVGVHTTHSAQFGDKTKPRAQFGFELSGPNHPPKEFEGKTYPIVIRFEEPVSSSPKANYAKLFKAMTQEYPGAKNFGQMLGNAFRGVVYHREWESGGNKRISAELKNKANGYSIVGPTYEDPETNEVRKLKVDMPLSGYRFLNWDNADVDQWDSVFIDGQFDDGNTKNKVQEKIKAAENFIGSSVYDALVEAGREAELEPAAVVERETAPAAEAKPASKVKVKAEPQPDTGLLAQEDEAEEEVVQETVKKAPAKPVAASKPAVKAKAPVAAKAAAKPAKAVEPDDDSGDPLAGL